MGYQIEYHLQVIKRKKIRKQLPVWGKAILLSLAMLMGHFAFILLQTAVGGQWQQTVEASEQMADALRNGESLPEAVQVFYMELIS